MRLLNHIRYIKIPRTGISYAIRGIELGLRTSAILKSKPAIPRKGDDSIQIDKIVALLTLLPSTITLILPLPACAGTFTLILVELAEITVAGIPLMVTIFPVADALKLVP